MGRSASLRFPSHRVCASWVSAFPSERQGRLLQPRSISGLTFRSLSFRPTNSLSTLRSDRYRSHARLGTRLLAKLCRSGHLRPLNFMRLPRRNTHRTGRADHLPNVPCPLPWWIGTGACVGCFPIPRGLPQHTGGSASTNSLSRPAQASLVLRRAGSLSRPKRLGHQQNVLDFAGLSQASFNRIALRRRQLILAMVCQERPNN